MRFRRDGRPLTARKIAVLVLSIHCAVIGSLLLDHWLSPKEKQHRPLVVRSVVSTPPPQAPVRVESSKGRVAVGEKKKVPPKPSQKEKKEPPPLPSVKPTAKQGAPKETKPSSQKMLSKERVQEIEESFATLLSPAVEPKRARDLKIPSILQASIDTEEHSTTSEEDLSYGRLLIALLEKQLKLPEIGQVKARITLSEKGRITAIEILDAKSEKNATCLKNQLPLLELPCFNDFGITESTLEFITLFRNVEGQ